MVDTLTIDILKKYYFLDSIKNLKSVSGGLINQSMMIETPHQSYLVQKINTQVSKKPWEVMENIDNILKYQKKLKNHSLTLELFPTKKGNSYLKLDQDYYRIYSYIDGKNGEDIEFDDPLDKPYLIGKAFAQFHLDMTKYDGMRLHETIDDFHHLEVYIESYKKQLKVAPRKKIEQAQNEIEFIQEHRNIYNEYMEISQELIPRRIVHNDAKSANILFKNANKDKPIIVDLDTVMEGTIFYDFGDMIRSLATDAKEDEENLDYVSIDEVKMEALIRGYIEVSHRFITPVEMKYLLFSGKHIIFELGIRFLTDYLAGDVYFQVNPHRSHHNLIRSKVQFKLVEELILKHQTFHKILSKVIKIYE